MNLGRLVSALFVVFAASVGFAKDRYVVIYKSKQGFAAMNSFMKLETGRQFGFSKSLPFIKAMILKDADSQVIESLRKHPEVLVVEKEILFPGPRPITGFAAKATSSIRAAVKTVGDVSHYQVGERTPWGITAVKAVDAWLASPEAGASARVLVLDSGLDTAHVALTANFEKGRNFYDPDIAGEDVFADHVGHGTHVSTTVLGAYNETTGFSGVAPSAHLLMGKVCEEFCSSVGIAEGIDWGVQEKVDVINMSLGGAMTSAAVMQAVESAENAGIFIAAASGNDASVDSNGLPTTPGVSYPAALPTVFAVGAVDSQLVRSVFSNWGPELDIVAPGSEVYSAVPTGTGRESFVNVTVGGQTALIKSTMFTGAADIPQALSGQTVAAGLGQVADFAQVDVKGKIALISRGDISFREKVLNARAAGALGAIIFNNVPGMLNGTLTAEGETPIDFAVLAIDQSEGLKLVQQLQAGEMINLDLRTEVTDYAFYNGTSMATPHVAGVAALVISAYKNAHAGVSIKPAAVRALLQKTATPIPSVNNEYGAGFIQAGAAVSEAVKL